MPPGVHHDSLPPPAIPPDEIDEMVAELEETAALLDAEGRALIPPDPTDFENTTADPEDYGIPPSAERFLDGDTYVIPPPAAGEDSVGAVPKGLGVFYSQDPEWETCTDFGANPELKCGYVIAPLDYSAPEGETIALAVSLAPATEDPLGTVLVNPGGPGSPGIDFAGASFFAELNKRFNIAGFDPRGVGASLPMIRCQSNDAWDRQRQGSDGLSRADLNAIVENNTNDCYDNTGSAFGIEDFIDHVGTVNVAQDLDIIRSALGEPKINYIGLSYGTSIGYEYARQFPDNIRAVVLDGVVDILGNNPEEKAKYEEYQMPTSGDGPIAQITGFQAAFEQFLSWCASEHGDDCALVDPGGDNGGEDLLTRYHDLARMAWGGHTYGTADGRVLSFADFTQATLMAMHTQELWEPLNDGLRDIQANPHEDIYLIALSDLYAGRDPGGAYSADQAAFSTVSCTDTGPRPGVNDDVEGQIQFLEDYYAAAPFTDPRTQDEPDRGMEPVADGCTYYGENFTLPTAQSLSAMPNILTIAATHNSAAPFDQGVVAAAATEGTLLIAADDNRTSYGSVACVTDITNEYFHTLRVPTDITGAGGVTTKDVHSHVVPGNECTVTSQFRPKAELESGEGTPGETVTVNASGLVRNTEYVIDWRYGSIALTSGAEGTASALVEIPDDAEEGMHDLLLIPGIEDENDPAVRAEAVLRVLPER